MGVRPRLPDPGTGPVSLVMYVDNRSANRTSVNPRWHSFPEGIPDDEEGLGQAMKLDITDDAIEWVRNRGGRAAIDFVAPIG